MERRRAWYDRYGFATSRTWFMVVVCLTAAAAPAAASSAAPQPTRLVLDAGLLARLQTLAAGLHNEIVLCLTGSAHGDTTVATGFVMPEPRVSEPDRAAFGPCPDTAVAIWHNHPLHSAPSETGTSSYRRPMADPGASPRDLCALSATDIHTAAHDRFPFVVVAVGGDTWCWWTGAQAREFAARKAIRGDPFAGQIETLPLQRP